MCLGILERRYISTRRANWRGASLFLRRIDSRSFLSSSFELGTLVPLNLDDNLGSRSVWSFMLARSPFLESLA